MEVNKRRRENHATNIRLTPDLVRNLLLLRHLQGPTDADGLRSARFSFEGGPPGAADEDTFEGADGGNPRECIVN